MEDKSFVQCNYGTRNPQAKLGFTDILQLLCLSGYEFCRQKYMHLGSQNSSLPWVIFDTPAILTFKHKFHVVGAFLITLFTNCQRKLSSLTVDKEERCSDKI